MRNRRILKLKEIHLPEVEIKMMGDFKTGEGFWSFILQHDKLEEIYGKKFLALKIFRHAKPAKIENVWWGGEGCENATKLIEATVIKNIYALDGLAPKVHDIVDVHTKNHSITKAQVVEYGGERVEEGELPRGYLDFLINYGKKHHIYACPEPRGENVVGGKYVDFQGWRFTDKKAYEQDLKDRLSEFVYWGPPGVYQTIPGFMDGRRNTEYRIKQLGLDKIDFKGKTVLDIGCSAGVFCHYAMNRGAKRVIGLETPEIARVAQELANYLYYWPLDFYGIDLKTATYKDIVELTGFEEFDIVFFLSMGMHINYPDYVSKLTKETLVYEGNQRPQDLICQEQITKDFKKIKVLENTTDLLERPVWIAKK